MQIARRAIAVALCLLIATTAMAEDFQQKATLGLNAYNDNAGAFIQQGTASISKKVADYLGMSASISVDAVTSATVAVDGITSATRPVGDDDDGEEGNSTRTSGSLSGTLLGADNQTELGIYTSVESTYLGRSVFINHTRLYNQENTSIGIGASQSDDTWRNIDWIDEEERKEHRISLSAMQLLSPRTKAEISYTNILSEGYLASPYRSVTRGTTELYEILPDSKKADAIKFAIVHSINDATSLNASYRYYENSWDIVAHTFNIEAYRDLSPELTLGARYRYYTQCAAYFTKSPDDYTLLDEYRAIDYTHSAFDANTLGLIALMRPQWIGDDARLKASIDYYVTSENEHIEAVYSESRLRAFFSSLSIEYLF